MLSPTLLSGAMGTELVRRGHELAPPQWSAAALETAPELVREIHREYLRAGARVLTANTTCLHRHYVGDRVEDLAAVAVSLARAAATEVRGVAVAGAVAMLPREIPADLRRPQYAETARALVAAGVDVLLFESFVDPDELARALSVCGEIPCTRWASLVARRGGQSLSGVPIERAANLPVSLLAVHCCDLAATDDALARLRQAAPELELGAYPGRSAGLADEVFAARLTEIADHRRLSLLGGCCGTTPETIAAISRILTAAR